MSIERYVQCKKCGGVNEIKSGEQREQILCRFCRSILPIKVSVEYNIINQYIFDGNEYLENCEFNKAFKKFKKVTELDKENISEYKAEAYFGMAMADFQVNLLTDKVHNRVQPICYKAYSKLKFMENEYYKKALEFANDVQKEIYEDVATRIDKIMGQFNKFKQQRLKWDCFICVKVSECSSNLTTEEYVKNENKTADFQVAHKIYTKLLKDNFKPFFSEMDCSDHAGEDYEALILYALYTTPCMLVVCDNKEYLRTPWVQNECTRFGRFIKDGKHKEGSMTLYTKNMDITIPIEGMDSVQSIRSDDFGYSHVKDFINKFKTKKEEGQTKSKTHEKVDNSNFVAIKEEPKTTQKNKFDNLKNTKTHRKLSEIVLDKDIKFYIKGGLLLIGILISLFTAIVQMIDVNGYSNSMLIVHKVAFYLSIVFLIIYIFDIVKRILEGRNKLNKLSKIKIVLEFIVIVLILAGGINVLASGKLGVKEFNFDNDYGIVYVEKDNGVEIWGIDESKEDVVIESEYNGVKVVAIHTGVGNKATALKSLTFNVGNITINKDAFKNCKQLNKINFASSSEYKIEKNAFYNCTRLKVVHFSGESNVEIGKNAFKLCTALEEFNVGKAKITASKTQDLNADVRIFGGSTNATITINGGSLTYLSDNVGGIRVGNNSKLIFTCWYSDTVNKSYQLNVNTAVFEEGYDFTGSNVYKAIAKDKFIFGNKLLYYSLADKIYLPTSVTNIPDYLFGNEGDGCKVYYAGTREQWNNLSVGTNGNDNYFNGKVEVVCMGT